MNLSDQLPIVRQVAAQYWERPLTEIEDTLQNIQVIKRTGGKVMGFLPTFKQFPTVFYKVYFNNAFKYEREGLAAANAMPQVQGIQVPKIIKIMPEHKAILTEKRSWEDTTTPIKRLFVGTLGIDWNKVGRWLRAFHDTQVTCTKNDKFIRRKFKKIDSNIQDLKSLFTADQISRMEMIIREAKDYLENSEIDWVFSHGDFGLSNIKIFENSLEIIDFEDCQMAPRRFDISNCLIRLEYARDFPNPPSTYPGLCSDFMQGYDMAIEESGDQQFFYLLVKLDILESYYRRRQSSHHIMDKKLVFRYFEKKIFNQINDFLE